MFRKLRMDANVLAAIISASGSAVIATVGIMSKLYINLRTARTLGNVLDDLSRHAVITLEADGALLVSCHDPAKECLLNSIRVAIVCQPVRAELLRLLSLLRRSTAAKTPHPVEAAVACVREQIANSQRSAMHKLPAQTHVVIRNLIESHGAAMATASDVFASNYDLLHTLEVVFNVFYVATLTTLAQWGQVANQLNGHLNGLSWNGQVLQYVFEGSVADALQLLNRSVALMHSSMDTCSCFACIVDATGTIRGVTRGAKEALGYDPQCLTGLSLSALQLGIDDVSGSSDLRSLVYANSQPLSAVMPLRTHGGSVCMSCFSASRMRFIYPAVGHDCLIGLVVTSDGIGSDIGIEENDRDDAHTRLAFCLSTLVNPTRRAVAACQYDVDAPPQVHAVQDGALGLPIFQVGRYLHAQMEVPILRVTDMYARCAYRLQKDLLRSASMTYTWQTNTVTAEFFLVGRSSSLVLVSVHRPTQQRVANPSELAVVPSTGLLGIRRVATRLRSLPACRR